jgi:uncharacterized protein YecE (DUF72 family)
MLYFGTSGFSYNDWVSAFYPPKMPRQEWLYYYAREFNALELNSTYYAIPQLSVIKNMIAKTGDGFLFAVKANQEMTHTRQNETAAFVAFVRMLQPFIDAGKLGCILAQFPYSFGYNQQNLDYLKLFRERMTDLPLVTEFRNAQWLKPDVFDFLRSHNIGFCCVDEPKLPKLLPPVAEVTSTIGYVRFHGRNAAKWWKHEYAYERYDYTYSTEELAEWLPKLRNLDGQAEKTFVFANNHWKGQAVNTIRQLRLMND